MPRKKKERCINCEPKCIFFGPSKIKGKLNKQVEIFLDEYEAIRLTHIKDLNMKQASKVMKVSAPTFCRILNSAHKKITDAIINSKSIKICNM